MKSLQRLCLILFLAASAEACTHGEAPLEDLPFSAGRAVSTHVMQQLTHPDYAAYPVGIVHVALGHGLRLSGREAPPAIEFLEAEDTFLWAEEGYY